MNVLLGLLLGPWMRSETKDYQSLHFITSKEFFSTQKTDGYMKSRLGRSFGLGKKADPVKRCLMRPLYEGTALLLPGYPTFQADSLPSESPGKPP